MLLETECSFHQVLLPVVKSSPSTLAMEFFFFNFAKAIDFLKCIDIVPVDTLL